MSEEIKQPTLEEMENDVVAQWPETEENELVNVSALKKIVDVVIAPTTAFKAVKAKPNILLPMIIVPILPLMYYLLFWSAYEVQMIQMMEQQFAGMGMELTRDMLELQMTILRWTTPIGAVVGAYVGALIAGLIFFVIAKVLKSQVTFKQSFSMVLHASIIASFIWLLHMVITALLGESNVLAPMTSLASLLPKDMNGTVLYGFLAPFEVISIWYYIVSYYGLRIVCDLSKKASGIIIIISFLITIALSIGGMLMTNMSVG